MNTLSATLTAITASDHMSIITASVGDDLFYLLLAEQYCNPIGESLVLVFKETEVLLTSTLTTTTANIHRAMIAKIEQGNVLTQVSLTYQETTITTLVPTLTFDTLNLSEGSEVFWMVNPSEISLLRGQHGI